MPNIIVFPRVTEIIMAKTAEGKEWRVEIFGSNGLHGLAIAETLTYAMRDAVNAWIRKTEQEG